MTTSVIVETHDWPVNVSSFPRVNGEPVPDGEWNLIDQVEPHSSKRFYVHSGQDILVQELPLPASDAS